jgi:hypothetical protein
MKKKKHRVTPEIHNQIKVIATELPALVKTNEKGERMYRTLNKSVLWEELTAEQQKQVGDKDKTYSRKVGFNKFSPSRTHSKATFVAPMRYNIKMEEPVMVNHYINLIASYEAGAEAEVEKYVKYINNLVIEAKAKQAAAANQIVEANGKEEENKTT